MREPTLEIRLRKIKNEGKSKSKSKNKNKNKNSEKNEEGEWLQYQPSLLSYIDYSYLFFLITVNL